MRSFSLFALVSSAIIGTSSALVDARKRTTVTSSASAYDTRSAPSGCDPSGCKPSLTRDKSWANQSRWSCKEDLENAQCVITYDFNNPQDIEEVRIKFWKGDERVRSLKITDSEGFQKVITSSGTANGYEKFSLDTDETEWLSMESIGLAGNEWISITEVRLMVD